VSKRATMQMLWPPLRATAFGQRQSRRRKSRYARHQECSYAQLRITASMFSFRLCAAASDRKRFRLLRALLVHSLLHIIDGSRKTRATRRSTEIATTRMDVHGPHFGSERKGSSVYDHRGDHVTVPSRPAWILHRGTRDGRVDIDNYVQRHIDASRTEQAKRRHHAAAAHNRTMRIDAGVGPVIISDVLMPGRPGALLRRAPLRTRTCGFHRIRLKRALMACRRCAVPGRCLCGSRRVRDGRQPPPTCQVPAS